MGRFFSDLVERALKYIYYDLHAGRGQEGFDTVLDEAEHGEPLCQMIVGNVY